MMDYLCACTCYCDWKDINYARNNKVVIERNGRESMVYAMEQKGGSWLVVVQTKSERFWVAKLFYNEASTKYVCPRVACGNYKIKQYLPI